MLAGLVRAGLARDWITLCWDGLAQKAGCPQERCVEVRGSWYDPSNPVLARDGQEQAAMQYIAPLPSLLYCVCFSLPGFQLQSPVM